MCSTPVSTWLGSYKHFYLLQGLVYLQQADGTAVKLTCSMPNANRRRGGVAYYCVPSSDVNFLCHEIDRQIPGQMRRIQVNEQRLPDVRQAYVAELENRVGRSNTDERSLLEKAMKDLADEELRAARLHAKKQMSDETWEALWREWQDQRNIIKASLESMDRNCEAHVATLDDALRLIAKAGILYEEMPPQSQQDLLRHMVRRVVINPAGKILRMELRTPFSYLRRLAPDRNRTGQQNAGKAAPNGAKATARKCLKGGSFYVSFGGPNENRTRYICTRTIKKPSLRVTPVER